MAWGEIDLVTVFAAELVVWWHQLAQMCALADPRGDEGAQGAFPNPKIQFKPEKNTDKPACKVPKIDWALKKGAQQTQQNIITERWAPRKHTTGLKKNTTRNN